MCIALLLGWVAAYAQGTPPTLRDMLRATAGADISQFPKELLDIPIYDEKRDGRYIRLGFHVNPSAERLLVLSRDMKLRRELSGWELAILPDDRIVYHHSQIHFAPTHSLEISIFDPTTLQDAQIYPPKPYHHVRRQFIERVAQAYKERGQDWFRENNHHMNPEQFDSTLVGMVNVDAAGRSLTFDVRFGNTDNARDPVRFSQVVHVQCNLADRIDRVRCRE